MVGFTYETKASRKKSGKKVVSIIPMPLCVCISLPSNQVTDNITTLSYDYIQAKKKSKKSAGKKRARSESDLDAEFEDMKELPKKKKVRSRAERAQRRGGIRDSVGQEKHTTKTKEAPDQPAVEEVRKGDIGGDVKSDGEKMAVATKTDSTTTSQENVKDDVEMKPCDEPASSVDYVIGQPARSCDMDTNMPMCDKESLLRKLDEGDGAFVKRSSGVWEYAVVIARCGTHLIRGEVKRNSIVFKVGGPAMKVSCLTKTKHIGHLAIVCPPQNV